MNPGLRAAVFVDKDGTLVKNVPYNVDPALLQFEPHALQALAALVAAGYAVAIVTNQSGLARGLFTADAFDALGRAVQRHMAAAGVPLAGLYHCPHGPGPDGEPTCSCRKPMPGLLLQAAQAHRLDLSRSWMVGDTLDDVVAGRRAGCRSILYDSGGETLWREGPERKPHARVTSWNDVARVILDRVPLPCG